VDRNDINLEFDSETGEYFVIWAPIVIGTGKIQREVLEDLRNTAHFGINTLIDLKLKEISIKQEA